MIRTILSPAVLLLALTTGELFPALTFGQIYWTASGTVWSMNSNGSAQTNLFPNGLNPPSGFALGDNAGDRGNVTGPTLDGWFFHTLQPDEHSPNPAAGYEVFAFTPDGNGSAVWKQLTSFSGTGMGIQGLARVPHDDSFVSFLVYDSSGNTSIVKIDQPLDLPGPVLPAGVSTLYAPVPPDSVGDYSWNPDHSKLVCIRGHLYPDNVNRPQMIVHEVSTNLDTVLVDSLASGLSPGAPVWSSVSDTVAFVNGIWGTSEGIYTIPARGGAIRSLLNAKRGGGGFYEFYTPIWAPDDSAIALWEIHSTFAWNSYDSSAVSKLQLGKKTSLSVLSPWYPWANRAIPFRWR